MSSTKRPRTIWRIIILGVFGLVLVAGVYGYRYVSSAADPGEAALSAMASPTVSQSDGIISFTPTGPTRDVGIIFYQGGLVETPAYAPLAQALAENGYPVFMPEMLFNLAVLQPNRAQAIIAANPDIERWVIGGHSLGGAMATSFALANPDTIEALFFYGSYPSESFDMSELSLPVLSVYGSQDGVATVEEIFERPDLYSATVQFVEIEGGNHAQFGDYGPQDGDLVATISAEQQLDDTVAATVTFLDGVFATTDPFSAASE